MLTSKDMLTSRLTEKDMDITREEVVWNGFFKMYELQLKHKKFDGNWTPVLKRELFHRGTAAAAVIYDPKMHTVGLIEQFRVGALDSELSPWCLEVVAGVVEPDESIDALIQRELEEEAGIKEAILIPITTYYSSPGGCNEKIHLYCALADLNNAEGNFGLDEEHEDIYFHVFPADDVFRDMLRGRTNNAATLIGLQWLQLNYVRLQKEFG